MKNGMQADQHAPPDEQVLSSLTAERDEYLNGWKRALADYENLKRESASRLDEFQKRQKAQLIRDLLPIIDTFEQALMHIPQAAQAEPWYQGLKQIHKQWESFLKQQGVSKLECVGQPFDPLYHEAIRTEERTDAHDNAILEVLNHGYLLDSELIRPAQVTVNKLT